MSEKLCALAKIREAREALFHEAEARKRRDRVELPALRREQERADRQAARGGDFPVEGQRDPRRIDHEDGTVSYREE